MTFNTIWGWETHSAHSEWDAWVKAVVNAFLSPDGFYLNYVIIAFKASIKYSAYLHFSSGRQLYAWPNLHVGAQWDS